MNEYSGSKRWQISAPISPEADQNLKKYPPIVRQILFNRGIATFEDARQFLEAGKPPGTSPHNMVGIPEATDRINHAIQKGEKIAIYGDYDADGVTATALLKLYLGRFGNEVLCYIPDRFQEGYGIKKKGLQSIKDEGASLVISVDCGVRSIEEARYAQKIGLDLIISDHHRPGKELPEALALINPKQPEDHYPGKDLAGVGLAYKIVEALETQPGQQQNKHLNFLDLVAIGTVADMVPLVGENRYLVREGLSHLRNTQQQGIKSLIGVSGVNPQKINSTDIGFALGPRINAAGRLDSAMKALRLLISHDVSEAGLLAQELEIFNRKRQNITRDIQGKAVELVQTRKTYPNLIFISDSEFHPGVVGLVASRLTDQFYRPSIVGQIGSEVTRASCRSISEFNITKALEQCADILEAFGGHAAAAGFTVLNKNLDELIDRLNLIADEQLSDRTLSPMISVDIEIPLKELDPQILEYLNWLEPTGYGNQTPIFQSRGLKVTNFKAVGNEGSHLRMKVMDERITYDAIAFRQGHWSNNMPKAVDLVYHFETNEFRGIKRLQLNVVDLKPSR